MKNKINITGFIALIIILYACVGNDTPRAVAEKFLKAMGSQDFETAKKYGTDETEKLLDMMNGFTKMSADSTGKDLNFEIIRDNVDGDNATIYYKEEGREGELQLPLVKIEGKWKVLLSKESINNTEGANIDIGATTTDTVR